MVATEVATTLPLGLNHKAAIFEGEFRRRGWPMAAIVAPRRTNQKSASARHFIHMPKTVRVMPMLMPMRGP